MVFWGIEIKPGRPYTHHSSGHGRLRVSQATLAIGTATLKSLVQCNVGDKRPVFLCALLPNKTESLQLDLEFRETEDVTLSVIGPRGVHLTGYYVGRNRQLNSDDELESFGEDIQNSYGSNRSSDDYKNSDSFINDGDPEPLAPSPVFSGRDDDDDGFIVRKKAHKNEDYKRLKKRCLSIQSDDDQSVPDTDDECFVISPIPKNNKPQALEEETNNEITAALETQIKNDDNLKLDTVNSVALVLKDKVDVEVETKGEGVQPIISVPFVADVVPECTEEEKETNASIINQSDGSKEEQAEENEMITMTKEGDHTEKGVVDANDGAHVDSLSDNKEDRKNDVMVVAKADEKPDDTGIDHSLEVSVSAEVVPGNDLVPVMTRKVDGEVSNSPARKKHENDKEAIQRSSAIDCKELADGTQSEEKKVKKKRKKTSKGHMVEENSNMNGEKEDANSSATVAEVVQENVEGKKATDLIEQNEVNGNAVIAEVGIHLDFLCENKVEKEIDVMANKPDEKSYNKVVDHSLEAFVSAEVVPGMNSVTAMKRKVDGEVSDSLAHKQEDDKQAIENSVARSLEVLEFVKAATEKNAEMTRKRKVDGDVNNPLAENKQDADQHAIDKNTGIDGNQSEEKKDKKKRKKTSKRQKVEENMNMNVEKEDYKLSATAAEGKDKEPGSFSTRTLSNGLVIEDLETGNSNGKVAVTGRKVKVEYVVKLKENGQVIGSNGKSPHRFRLGDKNVIQGLNVGLDGMRAGDRRRLTIPPSMSLGYKGTCEIVPPDSWLVYEVEMLSIR